MIPDNDSEYYRRRAAYARRLAEVALDPTIRRIHAQMAELYAVKAGPVEMRLPPVSAV